MARIRTIKPELWSSGQIGDCCLSARLTFIGLLNFCDDNGIHSDSSRRIKAEVFPQDLDVSADHVAAWVEELCRAGLVARYAAHGEPYLIVTGWDRHQKIERPTYRHPAPDGTVGKITPEIRRHIAEASARARRCVGAYSSNDRREVGEGSMSPRPRNGMESNGDSLAKAGGVCSPTTSIGDIEGWGDFTADPDEEGGAA
jgi:hypothetical protein